MRPASAADVVGFSLAASLVTVFSAHAYDERTEFWLNPSVSHAIDDRTTIEIETASDTRPSWVSTSCSERAPWAPPTLTAPV